MNDKVEYILQLIQTIFKSEKDKNRIERLHLANSKKYLEYINQRNGLFIFNDNKIQEIEKFLHPEVTNEEINQKANVFSKQQVEFYNLYKQSTNLITSFCDKHYEFCSDPNNDMKDFTWNFNLNEEEFFVQIFKNEYKSNFYNSVVFNSNGLNPNSPLGSSKEFSSESQDELNTFKSIDLDDTNLNSFLSNVNFIEILCQTCDKMKNIPNDQQMNFLKGEFTRINKLLPSNIYIPFVKDSIRNYVICHIPISEMKIFRTKNRAPYMLTIEVIRIDEIVTTLVRNKTVREKFNNHYENSVNLDDEIKKSRSHSMETTVIDMKINPQNLTTKNDSKKESKPKPSPIVKEKKMLEVLQVYLRSIHLINKK